MANMTVLDSTGATVTVLKPSGGQATMSGSVPVALASDQTAVPVSGTFWQSTQPVSAASLPLPAGASTSAKQPAIGVAGTPSSDVVTIQGINSMTALKVDGSAVTQPVSFTGLSSKLNFSSGPIVPTIQAAAYALGNCMGGLQTVAFFRTSAQASALLNGLTVLWLGAETTPLTFYIFNKNPSGSTFTDKSTFTIANADAKNLVGAPVTITPYTMPGATQTMNTASLNMSAANNDTSVGVNLYIGIEVGAAVTPAVGDLVFWLTGVRD